MNAKIQICVSDIPSEHVKRVKTASGEDKIYLNCFVKERRTPDKFGNNLSVTLAGWKDHNIDGTVYIGNGKTLEQSQSQNQ